MKDLRRRFERFCLKNRGKGIPNLMLVIAIGNLAVYMLSRIDPSNIVYSYLCFSRSAILRGQVWRLFSYIFTYLNDVRGAGLLLAAVSLFCYYQFGKILESYWGSFRFNLYYLTGLVLTDLAALLLGSGADASALNLSLFLAVATIAPEAKVLLFFFIPVKIKWMAILDACYFAYIIFFCAASRYWIGVVLPLVALLNFFVFFAPELGRFAKREQTRTKQAAHFHNAVRQTQREQQSQGYRHKCAVCGRTDVTNPELQFRYCSKCAGYHCFCSDHIFNHVHFTDENP